MGLFYQYVLRERAYTNCDNKFSHLWCTFECRKFPFWQKWKLSMFRKMIPVWSTPQKLPPCTWLILINLEYSSVNILPSKSDSVNMSYPSPRQTLTWLCPGSCPLTLLNRRHLRNPAVSRRPQSHRCWPCLDLVFKQFVHWIDCCGTAVPVFKTESFGLWLVLTPITTTRFRFLNCTVFFWKFCSHAQAKMVKQVVYPRPERKPQWGNVVPLDGLVKGNKAT